MTQWKAYNTLRVICAVAGWLGSCLFVWKDLIQLNAKSADLFRLVRLFFCRCNITVFNL